MKPNEFKKILKPLIEQAVREVLLQEGILSNIVAEVARGLTIPLNENKQEMFSSSRLSEDHEREENEKNRQEKIKRLNESSGMSHNVFSNVKQMTEPNSHSPLSGRTSSDSGVDITAIQKLAKGRWKTLAGGK